MITSLEVTDFRCFAHQKIDGLTRINVITGANGSGKSALLEALYLGANATGQAVQNINSMRPIASGQVVPGPIPFAISGPTLSLASYFDHFFRSWEKDGKLQTAKRIHIHYVDSDGATYDLGIAYQVGGDLPVPVIRGAAPGMAPILFDRTKAAKVKIHNVLPITVNQFGQLQHPPIAPLGPSLFIFGADQNYAEIDNVNWFSQLRERSESGPVVSFVQKEFPFVTDIEVLAPNGVNGLFATMADGTRRRVTTVSSGIYKIISILLAAVHTHNGIIVIDEIENGIFYEKYGAVWRILYQLAKETNNQIFLTSHSAECLEQLSAVIGENENDFCLLQTERENGGCKVRRVSGTAMKSALKGRNEIRGATDGASQN